MRNAEKRKARQATYYAAHGEELRAKAAAYRAVHRPDPEKRRAYQAAYHAAHRDEKKAYDAIYNGANRGKRKIQTAVWRAANHRDRSVEGRAYRAAHRAERKAWSAAYHAANPDAARKKYARRKGAALCDHMGCLALGASALAWQINPHVCWLCGTPVWQGVNLHMDHIVPLARGGIHCAENLRPACGPCNLSKGARIAHGVTGHKAVDAVTERITATIG